MSAAKTVLLKANVPPYLISNLQQRYDFHDIRKGWKHLSPEVAARAAVIVGGGDCKVERELMEKLPALKLIANFGVGYDGVDLVCAKERGVKVTNTPDVLSAEVADLCVALMLAVSRRIPEADAYLRAGKWESEGPFPLTRKMSGAKAGIVGLGRIGKELVKRLQAFDMELAFFGHHDVQGVRRELDLQKLAAWADYLIVLIPGRPENYHLIDEKVLRALGPCGILVNAARGSVVDEEALTDLLERGELGAAALDVFAAEPHVSARLRALKDRTVLVPHIGSATVETRQAMSDLVLANVDAYAAGRKLVTPVPECQDIT